MKARRILHASVNVQGRLEETRAFYADVLGLDAAERPDIPGVAGAWYSIADGQIHLVDAAHDSAGIDPTGPHFCVAVEDIDAAIDELEHRGIAYKRAAQGDVVQIWVTDPAGNTIELQQDRAAL